jgi:hypothetical protein
MISGRDDHGLIDSQHVVLRTATSSDVWRTAPWRRFARCGTQVQVSGPGHRLVDDFAIRASCALPDRLQAAVSTYVGGASPAGTMAATTSVRIPHKQPVKVSFNRPPRWA